MNTEVLDDNPNAWIDGFSDALKAFRAKHGNGPMKREDWDCKPIPLSKAYLFLKTALNSDVYLKSRKELKDWLDQDTSDPPNTDDPNFPRAASNLTWNFRQYFVYGAFGGYGHSAATVLENFTWDISEGKFNGIDDPLLKQAILETKGRNLPNKGKLLFFDDTEGRSS